MVLAICRLSLFGCILCCKALALYLFSIVAVVDIGLAVPFLSSNVTFPIHDFKEVFHFGALYYMLHRKALCVL